MLSAFAWVFNLDADEELSHARGWSQSRRMQETIRRFLPLLRGLLREGDAILPAALEEAGRYVGQAWCPTPHALRVIEHSGARLPRTPPQEVLRLVNHREYALRLGPRLPGAAFVRSRDELEAVLTARPGDRLLKRPFGFAGRGRRRLRAGAVDADLGRWIDASLEHDGLVVEPLVERVHDLAWHGWLGRDGALRLGEPVLQVCDENGAWQRTEALPQGALPAPQRRAFEDSTRRVAGALHEAGYFGPFGIDAFRWRARDGAIALHPLSDLNARYTMGWAFGMGGWRPAPEEVV